MVNRTTRLAYDENDAGSMLMKADGSPIADSARAHRILSGCVGNLSNDDMMTVAEMLAEKSLLSKSELAELKAAMSGDKGDDKMASDHAMSRRRAGQTRQPTAEDRKRFAEMFPDADRLRVL